MSKIDNLREEFERQAEWRRQKGIEYPNDTRNLEAAEIFDRLASSVEDCPSEVIYAVGEFFADPDDWECAERWQEVLREVGFYSEPKTAEEFCRAFIAERAGLKH